MIKTTLSFVAILILSACANRALDSKFDVSRKTQIKEICYSDVVVTKNLVITFAEASLGRPSGNSAGTVSEKTRIDGGMAAEKTVRTYQSEILDSLKTFMRPYNVSLNACSEPSNSSKYAIEFTIHRAFAERAPIGLYKTGVGINVKILEKEKRQSIWESEYVSGTEGALGDAGKSNVDTIARKIVWELYQSDWIEKR